MSATFDLTYKETKDLTYPTTALDPSTYLERKRLAVRILGVALGVLLLPIVAMLVLVVRLTSPGPGLYRQRRVGRYGEEFTIYKLRSMRKDAEKISGPVWAAKHDRRVTPVGRFLRYFHLDELPQIINVIRGEMDFVGPRPERPEIEDDLILQVDGYQDRHMALPGITGLAQINLEPDQDIAGVRKKVAADRYYIQNASLWYDLRLLTATVLRVLGLHYHYGASLVGVTLPAELLASSAFKPVDNVVPAPHHAMEDTQVYATAADTVVATGDDKILSDVREGLAQCRVPR